MILDEIEKTIGWLKSSVGNQDLMGRINKIEELADNSYYLATMVGDAHQLKNECEYYYKTAMTSFVASSTGGVSKNETLAKEKYKDLYKDWIDAENAYKKLQLKLAQVNLIIEQTRQSIAHLKREYYDSQRMS